MKKIIQIMMMLMMCITISAQTAEFKKSVSKYKSVTSLTAIATRTTHKSAVAKDKVVSGTLSVKKPSKVAIVNGKDALIMNGTAFTMKKGILKAKTNAQTDARYKTFHDVLEAIFDGGATDLSTNKDVKITKSGNNIVLTITPSSTKKMMFSSYILTIDAKAQELRTIRLVQKSGYTEYSFSGYKLGAPVNDNLFK